MLGRRVPFFPFAVLLLLLVGCSLLPQPRLAVSPDRFDLDPYRLGAELAIHNTGAPHTTLRWTASSPHPRVTVRPASGEVAAGLRDSDEVEIVVSVDPLGLVKDEEFSTTIVVESDGGRVEVPLHFRTTVALTCEYLNGSTTPASSGLVASAAGPPEFVPGELLVAMEPTGAARLGASGAAAPEALRSAAAELRARHGLELARERASTGPDLVRAPGVDGAALLALAERLEREPGVRYAHPNYRLRPLRVPNDDCLYEQWPLELGGMFEAWDATTGDTGADVVLAVIDTGVDTDHVEFAAKMLPGYDLCGEVDDDNVCVGRDTDPNPGLSNGSAEHGTHVTGIGAAIGDNSHGIAGIAFGSRVAILPVKVFDDSGRYATVEDLVDALRWAGGLGLAGAPANPHPADVINLSLGAGASDVPAVNDITRTLYDAGVVLVGAAGNYANEFSSFGVQSPANAPGVIAVGSVDADYRRSYFSDFGADGDTVDLMAPGGFGPSSCDRVRSTVPNNVYSCMAGTSMAAPYVAGLAALLLTREPDLTPAEVLARLQDTAYFDPGFMTAERYGKGVVCGDALLAGSSTPCGQP